MAFPKNFLFGSATSGHQIEGGEVNGDWSEWEQIPGNIKDNSSSKTACNSWEDYDEDVRLLINSNQNAYRLSIEWARIEPNKGKFDYYAIEHYKKQLKLLKKHKISTMVTLFHFVLPKWVQDEGGFTNKKNIKYFVRYASKIVKEYSDLVDLWATINEPTVYALKSYLLGEWCPGQKDPHKFVQVWKNLAKAHNLAYDHLKKHNRDLQIGIVLNLAMYESASSSIWNKFISWVVKAFSNDLFTNQIIKHTDFLGINHYMKFIIQPKRPLIQADPSIKSDIGWPLHPESIYDVLKDNAKWQKPIYITENGVADAKDKLRPDYIKETFKWMEKAIEDGVPLKGYFHWSLLDNFEWAEGYTMKFGLHTIDRKPRKSALIYKELIAKKR